MSDLHDLTALEQAAAVRARAISPVELVDHYLTRIAGVDQYVGAFITVTPDIARRQARDAERQVITNEELPVLHGVPNVIKDLRQTAGIRTTFGSLLYADFIPASDDHLVTLLKRAGTISLGKTNTPEFGLVGYTESRVASPARTPWDLTRSAGGSSGGAAAAVAAGLAPFAQGGDGGGSIRIPASACGVVGLKVSRGRVSNGPRSGDVNGLSWHGPIARTVRDVAVMLDAIAVRMPGDPHWATPLPAGETFLKACDRSPKRLRIGRFATPIATTTEVHPDCRAAWEDASKLLVSLGHEVEDISPPVEPGLMKSFERVWAVGARTNAVRDDQLLLVMPITRWLREQGEQVAGWEFVEAISDLQAGTRRWITETERFDAILSPTLALPPVPIGWFTDVSAPDEFERSKQFTPFTAIYNITGQPAISLPLYWNSDGLPIGVMLAGRPAGDAELLALAAELEAARPWMHRHPPLWSTTNSLTAMSIN